MFFQKISKYFGLIRFSHTLFALPFAMLSSAMALESNLSETPPVLPRIVDPAGILLCMVFARSAAMGFNRWADQKIDAANPRTARRHIPAGEISSRSAFGFTVLCSIGFIASTLLFLPNRLPVFASVPLLAFLFGYSFAKRFTASAHFWLGAALMLAPIAAWLAIRPNLWPIPWPPILLGLAVLVWSAGFDLIYACQDADFDAGTGLFSVPGRFGIPAAFRLAAVCHVAAVCLFASIPLVYRPFGIVFWTGVGLVALVLWIEHYLAVPKQGESLDLDKVNIAFFQMNVFVSIGLFLVGLIDIIVV